jgi:ribonuclease BN (tRNA processing enzyme)
MPLRVVPLGINGFLPSFGRQTMSSLVLSGKEALLLDAGTGVSRFLEPVIEEMIRSYDCLNVILSHYHLDHVIGLSYLNGLWTRGRIRIYAPGRPFVEAEPDHVMERLLSPPLFPVRLNNFPVPVEVIPVIGNTLDLGGGAIRLQAQNHPGGSMGIRIGDDLAYITDTTVEPTTKSFVQGVRLLLHEVWLTDLEAEKNPVERARHSHVSGVAKIAKEAKVGSLIPIHHHPRRSDGEIQGLVKDLGTLSGVEVLCPEEGRVYRLD